MRLVLPRLLNDEGAATVVDAVRSAADVPGEVTLDFSEVSWAWPFGTLMVAESLRQLRSYRVQRDLPLNCLAQGVEAGHVSNASSYLQHVGMFKRAGWDAGKAPGEAPGSDTYLPITELRASAFGEHGRERSEAIRAEARRLARMVLDDECDRDLLTYGLTETIRNVFEHSQRPACVVMAQKYRASGIVEMAIVDRGRGVRESLAEAYEDLTTARALEAAIEPGVSRAFALGAGGNGVNGGFGLYMLSEMGRKFGEFAIWSEAQQLCNGDRRALKPRPFFRGTALKLCMRTGDSEYFGNWFAATVADGDRIRRPDSLAPDPAYRSPSLGWQ